MLVANIDSNDYLGRIVVGRIFNGIVRLNDSVAVLRLDGRVEHTRVTKLFAFEGLKRIDITQASAGDIVCLAGMGETSIGETIASQDAPVAIPGRI